MRRVKYSLSAYAMMCALPFKVSSLNWILGIWEKVSKSLSNSGTETSACTYLSDPCPTFVQQANPLRSLSQGNVCGRHSVLIARVLEVLSNCLSNSCPTHPPTLRERNKCLQGSAEQGSTGTATVVSTAVSTVQIRALSTAYGIYNGIYYHRL